MQSSTQHWPREERTTRHLPRSKPLFGRRVRADQEHSVGCCSEAEASQGGSPEHHSGQGGIGESSHCTGALLTEGEKRLAEVQEKEKTMQSPFTVPEPIVAPHVQAEKSRIQETIDGLQRELANLRGAQPPCPTLVEDDEDMASKSSSQEIQSGTTNPIGPHIRCPELKLRSECDQLSSCVLRESKNGLRGFLGATLSPLMAHLKERCLWWILLIRACWVLLCLDQSVRR